ncbi:DUF2088 domain-containing protein [Tepidanaerobacter sp. GT38]|uniref:lactate racemase domain-containing protein n=1 Tax=Tepidanaerobacter sp. GT38 TaxID=2722793 RepID=UPI001F01EC34|nr:lactate racemase domain-containing protein [Tepidanaerobacter sp. GT38]MCG1012379.1 DUF2088 domain-containing protein [Tepidanaerobacter sp. GT38]
MNNIILKSDNISDLQIKNALIQSLSNLNKKLKKVLLLPPDITRFHSQGGKITSMYYDLLKDTCQVDIMPAIGTHMPMTHEEIEIMFGKDIPKERFIVHDWKNDIVKIGQVPGTYIREISEGLLDFSIDVEVNRRLVNSEYDLIISIGQVVPHEVVGMANYNKNIFVGCGGKSMIDSSHFLGAVYGLERLMGKDHSPVRKVYDYAENNFLKGIPLVYVFTVISQNQGNNQLSGLFIGRDRKIFEEAVKLSQEKNITFVEKPLKKVIVYLEPEEFKSTWVGNKAIYRTRMAIADNGHLIIIAPGVRQFGEDEDRDVLIRKYGYVGRDKILSYTKESEDLQNNLSTAAHLIHGSSDGRFKITYATDILTKQDIESVGFEYMPLEDALGAYDINKLRDGFNSLENGEEIFYISNPALGLWADKSKF